MDKNKSYIYRVVSEHGVKDYTSIEKLLKKFTKTGIRNSEFLVDDLNGQPTLEGYMGPFYGDFEDGKPVIRYESPKMFELFSM